MSIHSGTTPDQPAPDSPIAAIERALTAPMKLARADKKGKFPMAALKASADGASLDVVPLTVAMTEESFEVIQGIWKHLRAIRTALSPEPDGSGEAIAAQVERDQSREAPQNPTKQGRVA